MSIDLSKLTPAPWFENPRNGLICHGDPDDDSENYPIDNPEDDEFIVLARNAFDVMMRRGWTAERDMAGVWCVSQCAGYTGQDGVVYVLTAADPFTALVEADKWFAAQEKANA